MKIVTIIGARPQIIKAAAISRTIKNSFSKIIEEIIVHTGQHYDKNMSKVFINELQVPQEKYNLKVGSGTHAEQTAKMMIEIEKLLIVEQPNALLLYGDTNSTLAACLSAAKLRIPIIHIEAGVRAYNKEYPEEINRIICDHLSTLLFVPTMFGINCLEKEGFNLKVDENKTINFNSPNIYKCGDIMYDNTLYYSNIAEEKKEYIFNKYNTPSSNYILVTTHRPDNVDNQDNLSTILNFNSLGIVSVCCFV